MDTFCSSSIMQKYSQIIFGKIVRIIVSKDGEIKACDNFNCLKKMSSFTDPYGMSDIIVVLQFGYIYQ